MATEPDQLSDFVKQKYRHGFVTDIEQDTVPPGLNEDVIRFMTIRVDEHEKGPSAMMRRGERDRDGRGDRGGRGGDRARGDRGDRVGFRARDEELGV